LNAWHHVAFVADGSTLRLYRNGREIGAAPYHELRRDPRIQALAIGTKLNLSGNAPEGRDFNMWDGRLDELAIFNHALSPEQVSELYKLGNDEN
jgi:Concanavalin A-like lectin/glucanases superfamily